MSALTLSLKTTPDCKLDCSGLTPDRLKDLSSTQIAELKLGAESGSPRVGDYFSVTGEDTQHIVFEKSTDKLDYIGCAMKQGQITVDGDAGDFLGAGMLNGTIICHGNVGDRLGDRMRRGLILVEGNAGDYAATRIIAGTIGILGNTGSYLGFGMKRGTILLSKNSNLLATLQDCGTHTLPYLSLLFKSFASLDTQFKQITSNRVRRYSGDVGVNGRGEVLILEN
jgi:formylmethanofuran dehydrogenase subunit C